MTALMISIIPPQMMTAAKNTDGEMIPENQSLMCHRDIQVVVMEIQAVIEEGKDVLSAKIIQKETVMTEETNLFVILKWKGNWASSLTNTSKAQQM